MDVFWKAKFAFRKETVFVFGAKWETLAKLKSFFVSRVLHVIMTKVQM